MGKGQADLCLTLSRLRYQTKSITFSLPFLVRLLTPSTPLCHTPWLCGFGLLFPADNKCLKGLWSFTYLGSQTEHKRPKIDVDFSTHFVCIIANCKKAQCRGSSLQISADPLLVLLGLSLEKAYLHLVLIFNCQHWSFLPLALLSVAY